MTSLTSLSHQLSLPNFSFSVSTLMLHSRSAGIDSEFLGISNNLRSFLCHFLCKRCHLIPNCSLAFLPTYIFRHFAIPGPYPFFCLPSILVLYIFPLSNSKKIRLWSLPMSFIITILYHLHNERELCVCGTLAAVLHQE